MQHHLAGLHGLPGRPPRQRGLQVLQDHSREYEQSRQVRAESRLDFYFDTFFLRWSFDIACAHLFYLMTSDSYSRYGLCWTNPTLTITSSSGTSDPPTTKICWRRPRRRLGSPSPSPSYHLPSDLLKSISCRVELICLYIRYTENPFTTTFKPSVPPSPDHPINF